MADSARGRPLVAAYDLDRMTPEQVDEVWGVSIVTNRAAPPEHYLRTVRRRAADRLARRDARAAP